MSARVEVRSNDTTQGFWGGAAVEMAYARSRTEFIAFSGYESLVFDWQATLIHRRDLARVPVAVIWRPDNGVYQVALSADGGQPATQLFGAEGQTIGAAIPWDTQQAASGTAALVYLPQSSAGTLKGRLVAQWGPRLAALHPSGELCFPAAPRTLADGGLDALLVANSRTGGFARFWADGSQLGMRVYLSNTIAY